MRKKPINVLLYEDKIDYRDSFTLLAQKNQIIIDAVNNVDQLLEFIELNPGKYKFVILDARAYMHEGQTSGEDEINLHKIFREIKILENRQDVLIPYCINTAFADIKLKYEEAVDCRIFEKGDEINLIEFIWKTYEDTDSAKMRFDYKELFEFADEYFDKANIEVVSTVFLNEKFASNRIADRIATMAALRRLLEHLLDIIWEIHLNKSKQIITSKAKRANEVIDYLNENKVVPPHIFGFAKNIMKTSSNYGSHTPSEALEIKDYPTNSAIMSLTFGFVEICNWANRLLKDSI